MKNLEAGSLAAQEAMHAKWSSLFSKLGDVGIEVGRGNQGVMVGVLRLLKYGNRSRLEALAELCGEDAMNDPVLALKARRSLQRSLEFQWQHGNIREEEVRKREGEGEGEREREGGKEKSGATS